MWLELTNAEHLSRGRPVLINLTHVQLMQSVTAITTPPRTAQTEIWIDDSDHVLYVQQEYAAIRQMLLSALEQGFTFAALHSWADSPSSEE